MKRLSQRVWDYFELRLDYAMAMFNVLVQWHGLEPNEEGFVHPSITEFSPETRIIGYIVYMTDLRRGLLIKTSQKLGK